MAEASGTSAPAMMFVAQHTSSGPREPMRTPPGAAAAQAGATNAPAGPVRARPTATCLAKCETVPFETRHANLVAQPSFPCKDRLCGYSRGCTSHSFLPVWAGCAGCRRCFESRPPTTAAAINAAAAGADTYRCHPHVCSATDAARAGCRAATGPSSGCFNAHWWHWCGCSATTSSSPSKPPRPHRLLILRWGVRSGRCVGYGCGWCFAATGTGIERATGISCESFERGPAHNKTGSFV